MADIPRGNGSAPVRAAIQWDNAELAAHPVLAANAFMLQLSGQELVFTLGFAVPPFFSNPEDAKKMTAIQAKVISRIALTPGRATEIVQVMQQAIAALQAAQKQS
jgi:hypothetical protein